MSVRRLRARGAAVLLTIAVPNETAHEVLALRQRGSAVLPYALGEHRLVQRAWGRAQSSTRQRSSVSVVSGRPDGVVPTPSRSMSAAPTPLKLPLRLPLATPSSHHGRPRRQTSPSRAATR